MALLSAEHLAGPGYIILNVMRVINIITLGSVIASSIVMLIKTFIVSKFFFFDATSHVITALAGMFLMVSECALFRGYFARNWPLLSPSHGFVTLGCSMTVLGLNLLGNMNKAATSQASLGLPFWRLLLASGILAIVIGFFNMISSFVFRDSTRNITARRVRSKGAITLTEEPPIPVDWDVESKIKSSAFTISSQHTGATGRAGSPYPLIGTPPIDMASFSPQPAQEQNRFSQFDFNPLRAFRNARQSVLPSYHSGSPASASAPAATKPSLQRRSSRSSSMYSRSTSGQTKRSFWLKRRESVVPHVPEISISAPLNPNPQFAHLTRPNLAHHPSVRRPEMDFNKI